MPSAIHDYTRRTTSQLAPEKAVRLTTWRSCHAWCRHDTVGLGKGCNPARHCLCWPWGSIFYTKERRYLQAVPRFQIWSAHLRFIIEQIGIPMELTQNNWDVELPKSHFCFQLTMILTWNWPVQVSNRSFYAFSCTAAPSRNLPCIFLLFADYDFTLPGWIPKGFPFKLRWIQLKSQFWVLNHWTRWVLNSDFYCELLLASRLYSLIELNSFLNSHFSVVDMSETPFYSEMG